MLIYIFFFFRIVAADIFVGYRAGRCPTGWSVLPPRGECDLGVPQVCVQGRPHRIRQPHPSQDENKVLSYQYLLYRDTSCFIVIPDCVFWQCARFVG